LENTEELFEGDDSAMWKKELETIEGLRDLLENGEQVKKDYWKGN
jgi:hypothetical protein